MRSWSASCLALGFACTLMTPMVAHAAESTVDDTADDTEATATATATEETATAEARPSWAERRRQRERVRAIELQGMVATQLLPRTGFGGDAAFVFGHPNFQVRVGALAAIIPAFHLGQGKIGNMLQVATLDLCAAKRVLNHQIRMCVGGQGGGIAHRWIGFDNPGRRMTPWVAGTLKGDYQIKFTDRFGIVGGVGVAIPVIGPSFRAHDDNGSPSPLVFPGPMAGFISVGPTFSW